MLFTLFFVLSLLALGASVIVFCRFFTNRFRQHPSWPFQPAYIVGMCLFFIASWLILIPFSAYNTDLNRWQSIISAFISALQEFTIDLDAGEILKMADGCFPLQIYLSIFLIVSPILTVGALLSLLKDFFVKIRIAILKHSNKRNIYVFSELIPESVALADSIRKEEIEKLRQCEGERISERRINRYLKKHLLFIFADVHESDEEFVSELIERVSDFGALTIKKDITAIDLFCSMKPVEENGSAYGRRTFFVIGESETEKTEQVIKLNEKCREYSNCSLFFFSSQPTAGYIMDTLDKGTHTISDKTQTAIEKDFKEFLKDPKTIGTSYNTENCYYFRRIDSVNSLAVRTLTSDDLLKPLSDSAAKSKKISLLIAGLGQYGMAFLKNALWLYQIYGYTLCIHAVDAADSKTLRDRIGKMIPEIESFSANDSNENMLHYALNKLGESQFDIRLYPSVNCETMDLNHLFSDEEGNCALSKVQFVVVALGKDNLNIETAVEMRRLFDRYTSSDEKAAPNLPDELPMIYSIVFDDKAADNLNCNTGDTGIVNYQKTPYHIRFIGQMSTHFCYSDIENMMTTEAKAIWRHFEWIKHEIELRKYYNYDLTNSLDEQTRKSILNFKTEMNAFFVKKNGKPMKEGVDWTVDKLYAGLSAAGIMNDILKYTSFEYFRDSSIARELHQQLLDKYFSGYFEEFDKKKRKHRDIMVCSCRRCNSMRLTEHARWNAYMRVNGYIYAAIRNDRAKCHNDIKPWNKLSAPERYKD